MEDMMMMQKKIKRAIRFIIIFIIALIVLYPLLWMIGSSFKPESTIFTDLGIIPKEFTLNNYVKGWYSSGMVTFTTYFKNSFIISILSVIGNIVTCTLAAYAFGRLEFKGRNVFFNIMMITMMLPQHATLVPQFTYFYRLGWVNTFIPLILPKFLATDAFFIFLITQFVRGIPRELDEAAIVDGCNRYSLFFHIIVPLCKPALVTTAIFTFMWSWNDFFTQVIYLRESLMYTVTLALRTFIDPSSISNYGAMFAMSTISIIPILIMFIFFQKQLIEGVAMSGIKG